MKGENGHKLKATPWRYTQEPPSVMPDIQAVRIMQTSTCPVLPLAPVRKTAGSLYEKEVFGPLITWL